MGGNKSQVQVAGSFLFLLFYKPNRGMEMEDTISHSCIYTRPFKKYIYTQAKKQEPNIENVRKK
jgi:hypothetical protein